jgi:hypothetical protein
MERMNRWVSCRPQVLWARWNQVISEPRPRAPCRKWKGPAGGRATTATPRSPQAAGKAMDDRGATVRSPRHELGA